MTKGVRFKRATAGQVPVLTFPGQREPRTRHHGASSIMLRWSFAVLAVT